MIQQAATSFFDELTKIAQDELRALEEVSQGEAVRKAKLLKGLAGAAQAARATGAVSTSAPTLTAARILFKSAPKFEEAAAKELVEADPAAKKALEAAIIKGADVGWKPRRSSTRMPGDGSTFMQKQEIREENQKGAPRKPRGLKFRTQATTIGNIGIPPE